MASIKEIQDRIGSIKNTQQITSAMYMISSSKLQKAKISLSHTVPYFNTLIDTISSILNHMPDIENVYFNNLNDIDDGKPKRTGYLVITADKGLAGAYNLNVIKAVSGYLKSSKDHKLFVVGEVGRQFFKSKNANVSEHFHYTAQNPTMHRARMISEKIIDYYRKGKIDEVYIIYTKMINAMTCETQMEQLLPLKRDTFNNDNTSSSAVIYPEEFTFIPSIHSVLSNIVPNYIAGYIYGALIESFCSEQNSRMTAMQSSNKSANDMLHNLSIMYNRSRQAAITQEINEVIGGTKLLKAKKNKKKEATAI